ncbi:MAG: DEAD/DEAH box helicase family protein [Verrucomicrobia bacterium]|nr:DEAD/DEAH box helicase family protein [Verrucomicrobiota bacterium]
MIEWIHHRPPRSCNETEIRVAERLKCLADSPDTWTIIWGYYYRDKFGTEREGDFLILGPTGGLLVLEVKTSLPRHYPETGRWEGAGGSDPAEQLHAEWQGVIQGIKDKGDPPFVEKALCVPGATAPPDVETFQGIPRHWLVTGNNLKNWISTWRRIFGRLASKPVEPQARRAVLAAFGQGSLPKEKRAFIDHTEQLFKRQFESRFVLLDQLSANRQLLVSGGTGTGKTWHALEQAARYAAQGNGQRVLFLTYNKALTAQLRRLVALRHINPGEVVVKGWEELFFELLALTGRRTTAPPPGSVTEVIRAFYEIELPRLVLETSRDIELRSMWPVFDALVVDEGQDHDTCWPVEIDAGETESGGWWYIYKLLLGGYRDSLASIFYDTAQRPPFRVAERFDPVVFTTIWSQPAHVRLQPAVRYTRPLWQFICDHPSPATLGMIGALGHGDHLPEGPEPVIHTLPAGADACALVETILRQWQKSGLCHPEDVLLLHAQSTIAKSPLGDRRVIHGRNLRECTEEDDAPGTIRHTSIHKAKGLDAKAVILIGLPSHRDISSDYDHYSWFMAVSRARQLLAVVECKT